MILNFLSWNLWHSFKKMSVPRPQFLEPKARIQQRNQFQEKLLQAANFDLVCLQEVNPIRLREYNLQRLYPHLDTCIDQAGFRLLGLGLPLDFETGLVIGAKELLGRRYRQKLSPVAGFTSKWASLQLEDLRYLQAVEVEYPTKKLLVLNTHLHHGVEWTSELQKLLEKLLESKGITQEEYGQIQDHIAFSTDRKRQELDRICEFIDRERKHYARILLAGDFNFSDTSVYFANLELLGLRYVEHSGKTWDPENNERNAAYTNHLPPPVPGINRNALEVFRKYDLRPRNMDGVFVNDGIEVLDASLFGTEENDLGFCGSDHFGIRTKLKLL